MLCAACVRCAVKQNCTHINIQLIFIVCKYYNHYVPFTFPCMLGNNILQPVVSLIVYTVQYIYLPFMMVRYEVNLTCNLILYTLFDFSSGFSLFTFPCLFGRLFVRSFVCSLSIHLSIHFVT